MCFPVPFCATISVNLYVEGEKGRLVDAMVGMDVCVKVREAQSVNESTGGGVFGATLGKDTAEN